MNNAQARRTALIRAYNAGNTGRVLRLAGKLGMPSGYTLAAMADAAGILHTAGGCWKV